VTLSDTEDAISAKTGEELDKVVDYLRKNISEIRGKGLCRD
jgi:hypothetical protein